MAIYIAIRKIEETENTVSFSYSSVESQLGAVKLCKSSGEVSLAEPAPNDAQGRLFSRVAFKLKKHWEKGEFPDKTCWAS
jgi:hypothetical protein